MTKWTLIHAYNDYAALGLVPRLMCSRDNTQYVVVHRENYPNPQLLCHVCQGLVNPGSAQWAQIFDAWAEVHYA